MYVVKKKIGKNKYNYLKVSARLGSTVRTKNIAYLGTEHMSRDEIKKKIAQIPKSRIKKAKEELKEYLDLNKNFLDKEKIKTLDRIKEEFTRKLKNPDKKLIDDMFKDFKTFYIYNTNSIEGNMITLQETNLLLNEGKTPSGRDLREIYDHINEKECFDFILKNKLNINRELIVQIHSRLLSKIDKRIGSFRKHNVRVIGSDLKTTPAEYVEADIKLLLEWYNKNRSRLHPLILASLFHEKFERIHPFYDGNGRTGRMLSNIILINNRLPPIIIENKKRKTYFDVLSKAHKADLGSNDVKHYKQLFDFFYKELISTYDKIFSKWG